MTKEEREELIAAIAAAVRQRQSDKQLTQEETQWVRLAIKKEAQSIALRQAIIEKSLAGLVWAAVVGLGYLISSWATAHGWKA